MASQRKCVCLCMLVYVFGEVSRGNDECSIIFLNNCLFVYWGKEWVKKENPWTDYYVREFFKCKQST